MEIVVPWKSQDEWKVVGELVYIDDIEKRRKAYEVLRSWKSRCLKLPAGAECTFIILEALLVEDEMNHVPEIQRCNVLPSCYAMALTRFLNLAGSFEKVKTYFSLYRIARSLNLPEWIVNLRHQSSHGHELPSLVVLKAGVALALNWLDIEYWKTGRSWRKYCSSDSEPEKLKKSFSLLVVAYQDLMKLQISSAERLAEEHCNLDSIMEACRGDDKNVCFIESGSMEDVPSTVSECLAVIIGKLQDMFKAAERGSVDAGLLLDHFLLESLFLPAEDELFLYSDDLNRNMIPLEIIIAWRAFLEDVILKAGLLPSLMKKLVDFKSRQEMQQKWASVWVKYLASFLTSAQDSRRTLEQKKKKGNLNQQPAKRRSLVSKRKDKESPSTVTFDAKFLPENAEFSTLIEDVVRNPRMLTLVYIRELLKLYERPLSEVKADLLVKAIEIQSRVNEGSELMEVTYGSIKDKEIEEFCLNKLSEESTSIIDPGTDGIFESSDSSDVWENLPLGVYPEYCKHSRVKGPLLEFENDVEYLSE
ncbi:uncharacterized protein LOC124162424 [Ischnura elegans]|uniref:uncharacterized protein LOC124162424 n=1 Tax=Ischnura elegans TaxID=197161 RepID=UPI001ED86B52|nr:uncharacterized protein LOC124162424 [Ischnura elegans]